MNTGTNKNTGYLVALLLVVGLAAISNSMRELAEVHQFTLDTSRLVAQQFLPTEIPQIQQVQTELTVAKLESCENSAVEAAWLEDVEGIAESGAEVMIRTPQVEKVERRVRRKPVEAQVAKLNKLRQFDFDSAPFEFRVTTDENDASDLPTPAQLPLTMFKPRNRKHNVIRLNTRDREIILKTLNRSINLRTAS